MYSYVHKSATPFWVAAGYVRAWQRACAACALIGFHVCQYDGTFLHYNLSYSRLLRNWTLAILVQWQ